MLRARLARSVATAAAIVVVACGCSAKLPDVRLAGDSDGSAESGADGAVEASVDSRADGPPAKRCDWSKPGFSLSAPIALSKLNTSEQEAEPYLSADGLTLHFSSSRAGGKGKLDAYIATRSSGDDPLAFDNIRALDGINTALHETRLAVSRDGLTYYLSSESGDSSDPGANLYVAQLSGSLVDPTALTRADFKPMDAINALGVHQYDPYPSADNLRVYLIASELSAGDPADILVSSRAKLGDTFGTPVLVGGVNGADTDANPALTGDELTIIFNSDRAGGLGGSDLWYATRASRQDPFDAPQLVPDINSSSSDSEIYITPDGCEIYFASSRSGGLGMLDLYHSRFERP